MQDKEEKRNKINEKQRLKYQNDEDFRKRKQELARKYYQHKKYGSFIILFSNEQKIISFD
jgi:hypothetical protein